MTTGEEIQNFFFFGLWPMLNFLRNTKQNFPFVANPTTLKYYAKKIQLYNMFEDTSESLLKSLTTCN